MSDDPAAAAVERLWAGLAAIAPVLEEHGFSRVARDNGKGSGGYFASAVLASDLERFAGDFLAGPGDEYLRCWKAIDEDRGHSGPQRLARIERRLRDS